MIVSTKKRSSKYNDQRFHNAYGIQNWLCKNKFCLNEGAKYKVNEKEYTELIKEFVLSINKDFKKINNIKSLENYIQNNFNLFCKFVKNKYKNVSISQKMP